jgi:hypothetical protein
MIGIEVFEWEISFLTVLDCHSSPRRANGLQGELEGRMGVSTRLLLAMASKQWGSSLFVRFRVVLAFCERFFSSNLFKL